MKSPKGRDIISLVFTQLELLIQSNLHYNSHLSTTNTYRHFFSSLILTSLQRSPLYNGNGQ